MLSKRNVKNNKNKCPYILSHILSRGLSFSLSLSLLHSCFVSVHVCLLLFGFSFRHCWLTTKQVIDQSKSGRRIVAFYIARSFLSSFLFYFIIILHSIKIKRRNDLLHVHMVFSLFLWKIWMIATQLLFA